MSFRKISIISLKVIITCLSLLYIYLKLRTYLLSDYDFSINVHSGFFILIIVILLMPVNWTIESIKWQLLINHLERIKLKTSVKAVLSGITFAIFTPNRIGELAGRIFVLKASNRMKAVFSTAAGSLSQQIITMFSGIICAIFFLLTYGEQFLNIESHSSIGWFILFVTILFISFFILFNLKFLLRFLIKIKLSEKIINSVKILGEYSSVELISVLLFSFARYIVFVTQYLLLLAFFRVDIHVSDALLCIGLIYLVSSVIPGFALAEIGVRGSAAIFFMGLFSNNIVGIFTATATLWIINLAVPAVLGAVIFNNTKI